MAIDRGYGLAKPRSAAQSVSGRAAAGRAASRKKTIQAAAQKYGNRPFKGTDPFSKTAATLFSIPGTIAQGFSDVASGRRKVGLGDIAGVVAPAALAAGGMAIARTGAGRRAIKTAIPKSARVALASRRVAKRSASAANAAAEQSKRLLAEGKQLQEKSNKLYYPSEFEVRPGVRRILEPTENNILDSRFFGSQANDKIRMGRSAAQIAQRARSTSTPSSASAEIKRRLNEISRIEEEYMKGPKGRKPKPGELEW